MNTWALVLAAGEGSRLKTLTTTHHGVAIPKQFCSLHGGPSLLQDAVHRAEAIAPRQRICTIVAAHHRRWWEGPLWSLPKQNVIVQPENRGTAAGMLLPLLHILARDPDAHVVVLPSDHYVRDEGVLARSLRQASSLTRSDANHLYLLGIEPEEADSELGYVLPGKAVGRGAFEVTQFAEKPPLTLARLLIERGGLWNAFILAGAAQAFVSLYATNYPELLDDMRRAVHRDRNDPIDAIAATELYRQLPDLDFSRHVLEGAESMLRVLPVPACGWSDLGTPKRVGQALRQLARDEHKSTMPGPGAHLNLATQHARLELVG